MFKGIPGLHPVVASSKPPPIQLWQPKVSRSCQMFPGRRDIKNPFIGLLPHHLFQLPFSLLLNLNSGVSYCYTVIWFGRLRVSFLFVRMLWSHIRHENKVLDALVDFHQWDGENITVLGNVLYNNGLIFLFQENLFSNAFPLLPSFLITCYRWLLYSCTLCCRSVSFSKLKIIA